MDLLKVMQLVLTAVGIFGGLIAAFKAIHETRRARILRNDDLRWKKALLARDILNSIRTKKFRDATIMLDWTGREFETESGDKVIVLWEDLPRALRPWDETKPEAFTDTEVYIRDCFDEFFDGLQFLEHYLRTDLLDFDDIKFPMEYHIAEVRYKWSPLGQFIDRYDFDLALAFIGRFPAAEITREP